jgi:hypothetical protein
MSTGTTSMPEFKDSMGRYRTLSLFYETNTSTEEPVFTLKPVDTKGYISMKRLYLEYSDPTEYSFAVAVLGSWEHWQRLSNCDWFQKYLEEWRSELEIKLRSEATREMYEQAMKGNRDAAKWIADRGWDKRKAGRPTKEEVESERIKAARISDGLTEDAARIGLVK